MEQALLYVRVSSKEQEKEGYSLDAQEKLGDEYAKRKSLKIIKRWKVSESAWQKKHERVNFNQLIDYAKKHPEAKHIIFDITDRMTRNDFDKMKIYDLLENHEKTIHFSRTGKVLDKSFSPDDVFLMDIEVAAAKKLSNDISRKTKMGMNEKAEQGFYPSTAPLGYKNSPITHLIELDETKAPFVKRIFDLAASGQYSLGMIQKQLQKEGLKSRKGNTVGKSAVANVLNNPIYYGVFNWKGRICQGSHEPIVTKELFDTVQRVLHRSTHPSVRNKIFAFNNLVNCGVCGCKVLGERKKHRYNYYHCTYSKGRHKGIAYIPENRLAGMFEPHIQKVAITTEIANWLKEALKEDRRGTVEAQENRLRTLQEQYERINTRLSRLYDAKFDGTIDETAFKAKETEYKAQLFEIKAQLEGSKRVNPNFYEDACQILELSQRIHSIYVRADFEDKSKILKIVASNFTLNDASLYPTYKKPFDLLAKGLSRPEWRP